MSGILRLESLTKGNTLKQGDKTPLKYRLFDADGEKLNIAGKSAKVRLVYPDFLTIGYEKDGLTVAQDDTVTFTIDGVIPSRIYHVEIIVDGQFIFPSRSDESKFTVDKSSLGTEINIIEIVGVDAVVRKAVDLINEDPNLIIDEDKLVGDIISNTGIGSIEEYYQQFSDVIKELSEDKDYHSLPEIAGARRGYQTLIESLNNLSFNMFNTNLGKVTTNMVSDELLAQIAGDAVVNAVPADGSLTTEKFADKSITPEKATFIKSSTNLISLNNLSRDKIVLSSTGELVDKANYVTTDFIPYKSHTSYIFGNIESFARYNENFEYVNISGNTTMPPVGSSGYFRVVFLKSKESVVQMNEGDVLLPYEEPYGHIIDSMVDGISIKNGAVTSDKIAENTITKSKIPLSEIGTTEISDGSIIPEKTNFFKKSSNLFNKNNVTIGNISSSTGEYISGNNRVSEKIYVDQNADYIYKTSSIRVYFYDRNGKMIKNILNSSTDGILKITTTSDTVYLVFVMPASRVDTLQVNKGATLLEYEDYYLTLKSELLGKSSEGVEFASKEITGDYFPVTKTQLATANIDGIEHDSLTVSQLDTLWSTLANDYPQYVTKTELGYDASGTFKIYEYDFKPSEIVTLRGSKFKELPTVILTGGTHGNGSAGDKHEMLVGLYYFFKDICENWLENEQLYYFRNYVNFKIIPYVNPWGIENRSRKNANGVDINRNTEFGHVVFSDTNRNDYGGTAPWTEPETRYVRDMILDNPNAIFYIDFHTTGGNQTQDKLMYCSIHPDSLINYPSMTAITDLSNRWNARGIGGLNSGIHGYIVDYDSQADLGSWSTKVAGVSGGVIEAFPNFEGSLVESHGAEIMEMAQEEIGQFIWASLKYFKER